MIFDELINKYNNLHNGYHLFIIFQDDIWLKL